MPMIVGTAGGNKLVSQMYVGTSGGNKPVQLGYVGTPSGNKIFYASLSAEAAPDGVDGFGNVGNINSSATTVTVTGGVGPFTYLWTKYSGDNITVTSPTSATTVFRGAVMESLEIRVAEFFCTVTDTATGLSTVTNMVGVQIARA